MSKYTKSIKTDLDWNVRTDEVSKPKAKPKIYDNSWIEEYWLKRDRVLYSMGFTDVLERYADKPSIILDHLIIIQKNLFGE